MYKFAPALKRENVLKYIKQFLISLAGLDTGSHQYEFDIDKKFFEHFGNNELQKCTVHVNLDLLKQEDMLVLQFRFVGSIELICDRCLDPFDFPVNGIESVVLKFGGSHNNAKTDEEIIGNEQKEIDIRQYIFDFLILKIPFRKVHPDDENGSSQCDPEVISKLEELSIKNNTDPRWDQLKDIQIN